MTGIGPFGPPAAPQATASPAQLGPNFIGPTTAATTPATPTLAPAVNPGLQSAGTIMMAAGAINSAIGAFYAAQTAKYQLESEALNREFQQTMAEINARAAEADAAEILRAGRQERALSTLRYRAVKAESRARIGARGIQGGSGSAAEEQASIRFASEVDSYSIDIDAYRAARDSRRRAINFQNVADISGVNARNARRSGASINPALQAGTTLLTQGSKAALFAGGL